MSGSRGWEGTELRGQAAQANWRCWQGHRLTLESSATTYCQLKTPISQAPEVNKPGVGAKDFLSQTLGLGHMLLSYVFYHWLLSVCVLGRGGQNNYYFIDEETQNQS